MFVFPGVMITPESLPVCVHEPLVSHQLISLLLPSLRQHYGGNVFRLGAILSVKRSLLGSISSMIKSVK